MKLQQHLNHFQLLTHTQRAFRTCSDVNAFERFGSALVDDFVLDSLKLLITRRSIQLCRFPAEHRCVPWWLKCVAYVLALRLATCSPTNIYKSSFAGWGTRAPACKHGATEREADKLKKLLNPFEWTQHTLDNFTSWVSLVCGEEMLAGYWVFDFCVFLLHVLKETCYIHLAKVSTLLHTGIVQWYFKRKTCFHENKLVPIGASRRPRHHLTQI